MKTKTVFTICLFMGINLFTMAQARLGFTKEQIIEEFGYNYESNIADDGSPYITYRNMNNCNFSFYFQDSQYTTMCLAIPYSKTVLHGMIERLNRNEVIVSSTQWKTYVNNVIIITQLYKAEKENLYYFIYTLEK